MKFPKIDWPRTIAGALAAVAAAILLSKLGAAGTLIGAAIGSLVISVGTNVGAHGIQSTAERMLEAQKEAARRVSEAQAEVHKARQQVTDSTGESAERLAAAEGALESAQSELAKDVPTTDIPVIAAPIVEEVDRGGPTTANATQVLPAIHEVRPRFQWKRVALFTVASFVIALLAITVFELIGGRPLSSYFGGPNSHGTTVGDVGGSSGSSPKPARTPKPTPSTTPSATVTPTSTPTASATPSASATPTGTPTPTATATPTDSATPTGGATPTGVPTGAPTP